MTGLEGALAVVGTLVVLAGVAGGLWAVARSSAQDTRIKFLEGERADYLSRLQYIEPKLREAEQQNKVLLDLHNPADQIKQLAAQESVNHEQTVVLLNQQHTTLKAIEQRLPKHASGGS